MALQFSIVIVTPRNTFFSFVKSMSPKMYTSLKNQAENLSKMFKEEYKVRRVIRVKPSTQYPKGWKFI